MSERSRQAKVRLDELIVEQGLASTRSKAAALIMAGLVTTETRHLDKPGMLLDRSTKLTLKSQPSYASRGGDKLASVASELGLAFKDKKVLDVGASSGGFTDYALSHGASSVVAVDVGTAQLDWKLRNDPKVEVHEQTDVRQLGPIDPACDLALIDVSFISVTKIIGAVTRQIKPVGQIVALIKPQFEAGRETADRYGGVIRDEVVRQSILESTRQELSKTCDILAEADSKVLGPKGNRERFFLMVPKATSSSVR